jgi:rhamnosyltransferase
MNKLIGCIIVLYNPDLTLLEKVLDSVFNQVNMIYLADNSSTSIESQVWKTRNDIIYEKMDGNVGIAAAQNSGIAYLQTCNCSHIVFMDQDSIMELGMVNQLIESLIELQKQGIGVGAIGPRVVNRNTQQSYVGTIKKGKPINNVLTEVTELISSGSLVPIEHFKSVGLFDERLFIDAVDHEWCWRANYLQKLRFFVDEKALLSHCLGEGDHWFLVTVHKPTPFRCYYLYRNYFFLLREKYVPLYWKVSNGVKFFVKFFYFPLAFSSKLSYITHMVRGVYDGLFKYKIREV